MSSLVIAEILIFKDENSSDIKKAQKIFITFYPNSGTQFSAHASLSDAQKFVLSQITESNKQQSVTIPPPTIDLRFKLIRSTSELNSLDIITSDFLNGHSNHISIDYLHKTFISIIEQRTIKEALNKNSKLNPVSKSDPKTL